MPPNRRVAAIDIGTNSVLLLIVELTPEGPRPLVDRATITRLGRRVDQSLRLSDEAQTRTLECIESYAREIHHAQVDRVGAVGTSALRDAQGAPLFCQAVENLIGTPLRVIDGLQEAQLTFDGALSSLGLEGPVAVVDVGGGSTEIIRGTVHEGRSEILDAISLDIGSVRLTERHVTEDPPTPASIATLREQARAALREVAAPASGTELIGVGGTVTTLAAIELGLAVYDSTRVHGASLDAGAVSLLARRLSALPAEQRRRVVGLEPARADVIGAGACIFDELLAWSKAAGLRVSDRGVRWGLAHRLLSGSA